MTTCWKREQRVTHEDCTGTQVSFICANETRVQKQWYGCKLNARPLGFHFIPCLCGPSKSGEPTWGAEVHSIWIWAGIRRRHENWVHSPLSKEDRLPVTCCAALAVGGLSLEVGIGAQVVMETTLSKLWRLPSRNRDFTDPQVVSMSMPMRRHNMDGESSATQGLSCTLESPQMARNCDLGLAIGSIVP